MGGGGPGGVGGGSHDWGWIGGLEKVSCEHLVLKIQNCCFQNKTTDSRLEASKGGWVVGRHMTGVRLVELE